MKAEFQHAHNTMKTIVKLAMQDFHKKQDTASGVVQRLRQEQGIVLQKWMDNNKHLIGTKYESENHMGYEVWQDCLEVAEYESLLQEWGDWHYCDSRTLAHFYDDPEADILMGDLQLDNETHEPIDAILIELLRYGGLQTTAPLPPKTIEEWRAKNGK